MRSQSDIISQLTDHELKVQLIISQVFLIILSIVMSYFLFESFFQWSDYFIVSYYQIFYFGLVPGLIIVFIDLICFRVLPKKFYDDGGINQRIFKNRSVSEIFYIALFVAVSEELLFRGVIQTTFGYVIASTLFAVIHFRYLKKPVLFLSILFVSFYIGYLFLLTENLIVTITAHFIVDFILGLVIRFQKRGGLYE